MINNGMDTLLLVDQNIYIIVVFKLMLIKSAKQIIKQ